MKRFAGKTALVTGGGSGIGAATAELLHAEGARVVVTDIVFKNEAREQDYLSLPHDTTCESDWEQVIALATEVFGGLDILINNAGISAKEPGPISKTDLSVWRQVMAVNLDGVFLGMKHALRVMDGRGGAIVNIASVLSFAAIANSAAYCASKGGVLQLTRAGAVEGAQMSPAVRVNSVHPGYIETPLVAFRFDQNPQMRSNIESKTPMNRLGRPDEIAKTVAFLASDDASYATGAAFTIDGGYLAV